MKASSLQIYAPYRKIVKTMAILLFILLASYVFLVNQTVRQVVERKELEANNSSLGSLVSEYEFSYMRHKNEITHDTAISLGFDEANKVTHVSRVSQGAVVTLNR